MTEGTATFSVNISALHAAIQAVIVHADRPKLGDPELALSRVRFTAAVDELWLSATNGTTSALAAVDLLEDSRRERFAADDGVFSVDVHPKILRDLKDGITAQRVEGEPVGEAEITITWQADENDPGTIAVRDVGGLWVGSETTRPLLPYSAGFPDIRGALSAALAQASGEFKPLVVDGAVLAAFRAASAAYGHPLVAEPVGDALQRGWLVWCGPDFIGSLASNQSDSLGARDRHRTAHLTRLGLVERQLETI